MQSQLIDLTGNERRTPIYRVFGIQRLFEIFSTCKNTLVRPTLWDDPFENFILTQAIQVTKNPNAYIAVRDGFYGQCWSMIKESDAMWRIYSPDKNGVKVKTTVGKLFDSFCNSQEVIQGECFIGKVSYMKDSKLRKNLKDRVWLSQEIVDAMSQARSLLFKRVEFQHEAEVRLLYLSKIAFEDKNNLFHYSIEPEKIIEKIEFDPRLHREVYDAYKYYLVEKVGFDESKITQSTLYTVPNVQAAPL
jgi:hypothetical protein